MSNNKIIFPWTKKRILWVGFIKNRDCVLSELPKEIFVYIQSFLKFENQISLYIRRADFDDFIACDCPNKKHLFYFEENDILRKVRNFIGGHFYFPPHRFEIKRNNPCLDPFFAYDEEELKKTLKTLKFSDGDILYTRIIKEQQFFIKL